MKKIINAKRYDTDTAVEIAVWEPYVDYRNFNYIKETLYRKKTGEYFLHGEGGPLTKYRESVEDPNTWGYGEKIIPLTLEGAREWAEEHMDADEYEEEFELGDELNQVTFLLPGYLMEKVRAEAEERDCTFTDIFIESVKDRYK